MRLLMLTVLMIFIISCNSNDRHGPYKSNHIGFQFNALQDTSIKGSVLIYDLKQNEYYSNDFDWAKVGRIPASTFKIANSLIALELGIIEDAKSVFKWDGESRYFKTWEQNLTFKQAFHYSCVPCYQEIARKVGVERMNEYITKLNYGKMDVNAENIDDFWLVGDSKITQFEEIDFLKKLYLSELPISKKTEKLFKELFIVKKTGTYTLRAKTGLSVQNNSYNGWYVGYIETTENVYFFATNISPQDKYDKSFIKKRKSITLDAFKQLGII